MERRRCPGKKQVCKKKKKSGGAFDGRAQCVGKGGLAGLECERERMCACGTHRVGGRKQTRKSHASHGLRCWAGWLSAFSLPELIDLFFLLCHQNTAPLFFLSLLFCTGAEEVSLSLSFLLLAGANALVAVITAALVVFITLSRYIHAACGPELPIENTPSPTVSRDSAICFQISIHFPLKCKQVLPVANACLQGHSDWKVHLHNRLSTHRYRHRASKQEHHDEHGSRECCSPHGGRRYCELRNSPGDIVKDSKY